MIVYDYSNRTMFGMNDNERYIYAGWMITVVTFSLVGDAVILISSIKYGAFRLPQVLVTFIQHIAAADFIASLTKGLPIVISTLVNGVAFNDIRFNYFSFFMGYYIFTVSPFLIFVTTRTNHHNPTDYILAISQADSAGCFIHWVLRARAERILRVFLTAPDKVDIRTLKGYQPLLSRCVPDTQTLFSVSKQLP